MEVNKMVEKIKALSVEHASQEVVDGIELRMRSGSTGSEIIAMVGKYLSDLIRIPKYAFIKKEVELYLDYCKSIGLEIL